ncbi:MAG TPA: HEAT repeat domain-containing protein [Candidatus Eisenbacteria bacterium]|nr:HEAT repeat domain-containing protein [Candidatus Eisenbacteria bacterium]
MSLASIIAIVSSWIPTVFAGLVAQALKVTLLLLAAGIAALAVRRASSATRHAVWSAALAATLVLPVLTLALPEWTLPVLPAKAPKAAPVVAAEPAGPAAPVALPTVAPPARSHVHRHAASRPALTPVTPPVAVPSVTPVPVVASVSAPHPAARPFTSWPLVLLGIWIAGSLFVLARVAIGHGALLLLARRARPIRGAAWTSLAERAAEESGIDRPFELVESERIGVPATFGVLKPVVLLPVAARDWPEERIRAVLVHELAHAARYDCFTQLMAQIACALHWYHPGVWWAERRMRIERESACDDRVLAGRMTASDYADHLIEVLREARRAGLPSFGAVAFARRSSLEGRLLALLDPLRDRRSPSGRSAWGAGLATGAFLLALAGAQLGAAPAPPSAKPRAPLSAKATAAPAREVLLAPDTETDLGSRWAWAVQGSARQAKGGMWIGYELSDVRAGGGHGLLSDSEGIDLALLNGHATGPTLHDVLARRGDFLSGAPPAGGVAILFHVTRSGAVDRVRTQSFDLAPPLDGQPLYWLGKAGDAQSLAWLEQLDRRVAGEPARRELLAAASYHRDAESVNAWLGEVAQNGAHESLRAEAAEGLGRHPTPASLRVLDKLAREDRSAEVRKSAIEALGEVDDPAAASVLFDIARSHDDVDMRREAVEALGETATDERADQMAHAFALQTEALAQESLQKSCEAVTKQCKEGAKKCKEEKQTCQHSCTQKTVETAVMAEVASQIASANAAVEAGEAGDANDEQDSDDIQVQVEAVEALGNLPEDKALPRLAKLARTHAVSRVRREACETIGHFKSEQALALLEDLAWSAPDPAVQTEAVETFGQFEPAQQLPRLTRIARTHPRPEVRRQAVQGLAELKPEIALPILEGIVQSDTEMAVKVEAVEAIGNLPDKAGTHALERIAKSKLPAQVRREAIEALGNADPEAALPVLEEILGDKQPTP